jgi:Ala-tRNA(Pro) deacylase
VVAGADERERVLYARLRELGIGWTTHVHAPVFTVEEASVLYASQPGGHTKNLFLRDRKGGLWLVVARDELRIDLNTLAKELGATRFSFGTAESLLDTLGIEPGSVTPFAVMNDGLRQVRVVLDKGLLALDPLNFHPLRNDRTSAITAADLLKFLAACEHEPIIVKLPERK